MKVVIRIFCNEGYDIFEVNDMYIVLKEWQVKGIIVVVCFVDELNKNVEVRKLEGFSKFYNFFFEFEGICVW